MLNRRNLFKALVGAPVVAATGRTQYVPPIVLGGNEWIPNAATMRDSFGQGITEPFATIRPVR